MNLKQEMLNSKPLIVETVGDAKLEQPIYPNNN